MTATNRPVFNLSRLFVLAAVIAWILVVFGVQYAGLDPVEEVAVGLALFGIAGLV
jgi:hypothetical protein